MPSETYQIGTGRVLAQSAAALTPDLSRRVPCLRLESGVRVLVFVVVWCFEGYLSTQV